MIKSRLNATRQRLLYMTSDLVTTSIAFLLFDISRFYILNNEIPSTESVIGYLTQPKLILEQILIPLSLLGVYWLS